MRKKGWETTLHVSGGEVITRSNVRLQVVEVLPAGYKVIRTIRDGVTSHNAMVAMTKDELLNFVVQPEDPESPIK
jgi:hypothetical protein